MTLAWNSSISFCFTELSELPIMFKSIIIYTTLTLNVITFLLAILVERAAMGVTCTLLIYTIIILTAKVPSLILYMFLHSCALSPVCTMNAESL